MTKKFYLDAGTTYSKIIMKDEKKLSFLTLPLKSGGVTQEFFIKAEDTKAFHIIPSKKLKELDIKFTKTCGHMGKGAILNTEEKRKFENEIIALAQGAQKKVPQNATVLDLGSRDVKWIRFQDGKFQDMDWNNSCASSTGATVEMLLKFYDISLKELSFNEQKFPVTCGVFGLEKIMDDITKGEEINKAISKFIHGIAFNTWNFAKKPEKIFLSGGFCDNLCFVESLKNYCEVELLGRFVLCEGLIGHG